MVRGVALPILHVTIGNNQKLAEQVGLEPFYPYNSIRAIENYESDL